MLEQDTRELMGEAKFFEGYSRWMKDKNRYETWEESVSRVMDMHRTYYADKMTDELSALIDKAEILYNEKRVLGAQRALQFGGDQLLKHHLKLYNCLSTYADRPAYFGELFYSLLCGAGVGFSVQFQHISKLPNVQVRKKQAKIYKPDDSIEGWATCLDILMSSFFVGGGKHPEYEGNRVFFDLSNIRPKGSLISGGFKAPGPEPLRKALDLIENVLNNIVLKGGDTLRPIHVYDISMYTSDAVLSGGVRRAATICLFSKDDEEMMKAKTGNWVSENPQRARSNNSVMLVRDDVTKDEFSKIMENVKGFGEPGFVFVEDAEFTFNPCITKDSWVTTKDGARQVSDLIGRGKQSLLLNGKWVDTTDHGFIQTGTKDVYEIKLDNGTSIKATDNHKIMTDRGWVEVKDLSDTDYVKLSNNSDMNHEDNSSFEKGWLIGNLIGDGTFCKDVAKWSYWGEEKDLGETCQSYILSEFRQNNGHDERRDYTVDDTTITQSLYSTPASTFFDEEFGIKQGSKKITESLEKGGFNLMRGVVSGLFDADGSVYGNSSKGIALSITQNTLSNLESVQRVLMRYGIFSRICLDRAEGWTVLPDGKGGEKEYWTKDVYRLYVSGRYHVSKFFETFKPNNTAKVEKYESIVSGYTRSVYKPKEAQSRVVSVTHAGIEDVYDCSVPETLAFESNGMWIHNCVEIGKYPVHIDENGDKHSGFQGCVGYDTKLITKDGIEIIGDVATNGESIEVWNGENWSMVSPIKTNSDVDMYRVSFGDGSFLDATDYHKFLVKNRFQKEYQEVTTKELIDIINTSKYAISVPRANVKLIGGKSEPLAYDYGFILGDGCATKQNGAVRKPFAEVYEHEFQYNFPFKDAHKGSVCTRYGTDFYRVYFDGVDKDFCFDMKYSHGIPKDIFGWDRDALKEFFSGWIDSDGTKTVNGFRIYGREDKIRDGQLLLTKLGVNSSVNLMAKAGEVVSNGRIRKNDVWYIQVSNPMDLTCNKFELTENVKPIAKGKHQTVVSIEKLDGKHDSYCFEEFELHQGVFNNVLTKQCNLTEINGSKADTKEDFIAACEAAAILGTLQAGYTDFKFVTEITKKIFERESLIGCSVTGWLSNPDVLLDESIMQEGAKTILRVNKMVAKILDINPAARTTCVKPAGNAAVLLATISASSADHAPRYIRNIQINKEQEVAKYILGEMPYMVEESVWSNDKSDYIISFPVIPKEGTVFKRDVNAIDMLDVVKKIQSNWVEFGTDESLCLDKRVRHNVSNTINVGDDEWGDVEKYIYDNRHHFAGISLLSKNGDKDFNQAPMTEVKTEGEIVAKYGAASLFASGLIVDTYMGFHDLWEATYIAQLPKKDRPNGELGDNQSDWVRRFQKFATTYFDGDQKKAEYCLKEVYLLHKWTKIQQNMKPLDFVSNLGEKEYTDIDTTGAAACSGPQGCEI